MARTSAFSLSLLVNLFVVMFSRSAIPVPVFVLRFMYCQNFLGFDLALSAISFSMNIKLIVRAYPFRTLYSVSKNHCVYGASIIDVTSYLVPGGSGPEGGICLQRGIWSHMGV